MTATSAQAMMRLAYHCLGPRRSDWCAAMQAEFEEAVRDRKPLTFAIGCLFAAWREMVTWEEGRGVLARYALAIGMLLPMAALQLSSAVGLPTPYGVGAAGGMLANKAGMNPYLICVEASAASLVTLLSLLLAAAHVALAWTLVDEDWPRIVKSGAVIGAATITLALFAGIMMLDLSALVPQVAGLAIEYVAIGLVARRHARSIRALPHLVAD